MNEAIRERVTLEMIEALRSDLPPWRQPWGNIVQGLPCNVLSKNPYRGINRLLLMAAMKRKGFVSPYWGTATAWRKLKAEPSPSEQPVTVMFFGIFSKKNKQTKAVERYTSGKEKKAVVWRQFPVYNFGQVSITETLANRLKFHEQTEPVFDPAENLIRNSGAEIRFGGGKALYRPNGDFILLPHREGFDTQADFYETAFHELVHWTKPRIKRRTNEYRYEELVAEIGACILLMELGVPMADKMLENSKQYVSQWMTGMTTDHKFVFDAAADAEKAVKYLLNLTPAKVAA